MKFGVSFTVLVGAASLFAAPFGDQPGDLLCESCHERRRTAPGPSDSLAVRPNGDLYTADAGGMMWKLSGMVPTPVGPLGFAGVGDLDYGNGGLWGFSNTTGALFFFDHTSSSVSSQTVLSGLGGLTVTGVAHRGSDNSLFLSARNGFNNDSLFQVVGSSANLVGSMVQGDAFSYISDIDFEPATGKLYAMTWFHRYFYEVNTLTAGTSLVSVGPHRNVTGLALQAVPEPATMALLGFGWLALLMRKRE